MTDNIPEAAVLTENKIPLAISSCLLGDKVRFDGNHKYNAYINQTLNEYFSFRPVCPEVGIGLGVPRPPIRLEQHDNGIRACGVRDSTQDVTNKLQDYADQQHYLLTDICGYILKSKSPSCGMERVKVYQAGMPTQSSSGIYAKQLMHLKPLLPFEEEGRLGDAVLRECFIERVFIYDRLQSLLAAPGGARLGQFHAQHKFNIMSHDQDSMRLLGKLVATTKAANLSENLQHYAASLMQTLKQPATRQNHVNVLQHIQGFLKITLDKDDKQELNETIEAYRLGIVPLIVPITLLKHHFRKAPDDYITQSFYMQPYPVQLALRNQI